MLQANDTKTRFGVGVFVRRGEKIFFVDLVVQEINVAESAYAEDRELAGLTVGEVNVEGQSW